MQIVVTKLNVLMDVVEYKSFGFLLLSGIMAVYITINSMQ